MAQKTETYFAQFTDLHVGGVELICKQAECNLQLACEELEKLEPKPAFVLFTGDVVTGGTEAELQRYKELIKDFSIPLWHAPSGNHDVGRDAKAWEKVLGEKRHRFDHAGVRFLMLDECYERLQNGVRAKATKGQLEWLRAKLDDWKPAPTIITFHAPILPQDDDYADVWSGSNADELITLLNEYDVLAIITGHWHRNDEWNVGGIRLINTGSLLGQQWTAIPPHYFFPTRPGYKMFWLCERELRCFWREIKPMSAAPNEPQAQVNLVWCGKAHTMGPRPQVRPPIVFSKARLLAQACAWETKEEIVKVEWAILTKEKYAPGKEISKPEWIVHQWLPMERTFAKLWSEWVAFLEPQEFEEGDYALSVRAFSASGIVAYDNIPITISHLKAEVEAKAGPETVFEMYYPPE